MKIMGFLVTLLVFIFSVLLFPQMNEAIIGAEVEGPLKSVLLALPVMYLVVLIGALGYQIFGEEV